MNAVAGVRLRQEIRDKLRRAKDDAGGLVYAPKKWKKDGHNISRDMLSNFINGVYVSENDDRRGQIIALLTYLDIETDDPFEDSSSAESSVMERGKKRKFKEHA